MEKLEKIFNKLEGEAISICNNKLTRTEGEIIEKYIKMANNFKYYYGEQLKKTELLKKQKSELFDKYCDEQKQKDKWLKFYEKVCIDCAKLEIELDLAKAKIQCLEDRIKEN